MSEKTLHIVNGDGLAEQMQELNLPGELIIWRELLCEGPTNRKLNDKFFKMRKKFLLKAYDISAENYEERFISEVESFFLIRYKFQRYSIVNQLAYSIEDLSPSSLFFPAK